MGKSESQTAVFVSTYFKIARQLGTNVSQFCETALKSYNQIAKPKSQQKAEQPFLMRVLSGNKVQR